MSCNNNSVIKGHSIMSITQEGRSDAVLPLLRKRKERGEEERGSHVESIALAIRQEAGVGQRQKSKSGVPHLRAAD